MIHYRKLMQIVLPVTGAIMLSSCAVFHPPERDLATTAGVSSEMLSGGNIHVANRWWETFEDTRLNKLIDTALTNSTSIAQAEARLRQAEALAIQTGAARVPEISLKGSGSATRQNNDSVSSGQTGVSENYGLGIAASYELDLWGRVLAKHRASGYNVTARRADWETAAMSLSAEIALRYFELLSTRQTIDLLKEQLATNRDVLHLIELRFRRSQSTILDVLEQEEIVARTEALLPLQRAREETLLHEIAVLTGNPPSTDMTINMRRLPELHDMPFEGIPAEILTKRPDIQAAWERLSSADWSVSAAKAARLPAIKITATGQYENEHISSLFDNWLLNLAENLTVPLFDAGKHRAEVRRTEAVADERLQAYKETVLIALQEARDAMSREKAQVKYLSAVKRQLTAARSARKQAFTRYGKGSESYLRVLNAEASVDSLTRTLVAAEYERLSYRIQLYRAAGGDWRQILKEASAMDKHKGIHASKE